MKITLTPMRRDDRLILSRSGDILTMNDEVWDLSEIPEGAVLPKEAVESAWFASDITRKGGVLEFSVILPHGINAPEETVFPAPVFVRQDGPIALPQYEVFDDEN